MRPRTARIVFGGVLIGCMVALIVIAVVAYRKGNAPLPVATITIPTPVVTVPADAKVIAYGVAYTAEEGNTLNCSKRGDGWRCMQISIINSERKFDGTYMIVCAPPDVKDGLPVDVKEADGQKTASFSERLPAQK